MLDEFSQLVLDLYRASEREEPEKFRRWAFDRLKESIEFESGIWIQGVVVEGIPVTNHVYLFNQPDKMLEDYAQWSTQDVLFECVLCNPLQAFLASGLNDMAVWRETPFYKEFSSKYHIDDAVGIMVPMLNSGIQSFLSLYRSDPDKLFSEDDRCLFQAISPHLVEFQNRNAFLHVRRQHQIDSFDLALAIADEHGQLKMAEMRFIDHLDSGWPDWDPPQLPDSLLAVIGSGKKSSGLVDGYLTQVSKGPCGLVCGLRPKRVIDKLTPRQHQVALELSDGRSYKEIAQRLSITHSTVTNHVNAIYRKLGVTKSSELRRILEEMSGS